MFFKSFRFDESFIIDSNSVGPYLTGGCTHRSNGPAVIRDDGNKSLVVNERYHRSKGQAEIYHNGDKHWAIDGVFIKVHKYD